MKKLLIVADYNDGDYSEHVVRVEDEVFNKFLPLIKAIANFKPYIRCSSFGGVVEHNWQSSRLDLGEKDLYETYSQFSKEYIDEFNDIFMSGLTNPYEDWGCGFHTIVTIQDIVTDEYYVDWKQDWESCEKRYNDKVKGYLKERSEIYSYKREKDGKPLDSIPYSEMTPYESELIKRLDNLWIKYQ